MSLTMSCRWSRWLLVALGAALLVALTACSSSKTNQPTSTPGTPSSRYHISVTDEELLSFLALNSDQVPDGYVFVSASYDETSQQFKVDYFSSSTQTVLSGIMNFFPTPDDAKNSLDNLEQAFSQQGYVVTNISDVDGFAISQSDATGSLFAAQFRSDNLIGGVAIISSDPEYDGSSTVLTAAQSVYSRMVGALQVGDTLTIPNASDLLTELNTAQTDFTTLQTAISTQIAEENADIGSAALNVVSDCEPFRTDQYLPYWMVVAPACDKALEAVGAVLNDDLSTALSLMTDANQVLSNDVLPPLQDFVKP